jgi:GNAT superfamily N-acetyltransferase
MFVRTAGERDLVAIRALLVETWHATYDAIHGVERVTQITDEWHSIAALKTRLTRPNSEFLVADDGKRIGGMAFAEDAGGLRGIGGMLLDEIIESFPEARAIRLEVDEKNAPAIAFYEANGFTRTGRTDNCGADQSAIPALVYERTLT